MTKHWVVEFDSCQEVVIRTGVSPEEVNQPDDLGCPVARIRPLTEVQLRGCVWEKDGELRCLPI